MLYTSITPEEKNAGSVALLTTTFATLATLTVGVKKGPMSGILRSGRAFWKACRGHKIISINLSLLLCGDEGFTVPARKVSTFAQNVFSKVQLGVFHICNLVGVWWLQKQILMINFVTMLLFVCMRAEQIISEKIDLHQGTVSSVRLQWLSAQQTELWWYKTQRESLTFRVVG